MKYFSLSIFLLSAIFSVNGQSAKIKIDNVNKRYILNTFFYTNPVEGFTIKVGGRTTPKFSNFIYLDNYFAYGTKDKILKYQAGITYSFNHKSIYSYPLNYLKVSYQYDTDIPGQQSLVVNEDNFLLSFKRGNNNKWLYNNYFKTGIYLTKNQLIQIDCVLYRPLARLCI